MTTLAQTPPFAISLPNIGLKKRVRLTSMDPQDVARRIRTARAWAGLSQEDLAEALEISKATLGRWERGEKLPRPAELYYIAELCGVDREWFTQNDDGLQALSAAVSDVERMAREELRSRSETGGRSDPAKKNR